MPRWPKTPPADTDDTEPLAFPIPRKRRSKHSPTTKLEAVVTAAVIKSSRAAGRALGVPDRTIRYWTAEIRAMDSSEREAFIAQEQSVARVLYAVHQVENLEFAAELRAAGRARDVQSATTSAAICGSKLAEASGDRVRFGSGQVIEHSPGPDDATRRLLDRLSAPPEPATPVDNPDDGE